MDKLENRLYRCFGYVVMGIGLLCAIVLGVQFFYGGNPLGLIGINRPPGDSEALAGLVISVAFFVVGVIICLVGRERRAPIRRLRRPPRKDWT